MQRCGLNGRTITISVIYMISPTDTPFQANIAKVKATATKHE